MYSTGKSTEATLFLHLVTGKADTVASVPPLSLFPQGKLPPRLFTVGRLDVATTGLIFMTNDGAFPKLRGHKEGAEAYMQAQDESSQQVNGAQKGHGSGLTNL